MKYLGIDMTKKCATSASNQEMHIKTKISFCGSHIIRSIKTKSENIKC